MTTFRSAKLSKIQEDLVEKKVVIANPTGPSVEIAAGQFCLIPAGVRVEVWPNAGARYLSINGGAQKRLEIRLALAVTKAGDSFASCN